MFGPGGENLLQKPVDGSSEKEESSRTSVEVPECGCTPLWARVDFPRREESILSQTWHSLGQVSCFLATSLPICLTSTPNYAWRGGGVNSFQISLALDVQEGTHREGTASGGGGETRRQPGLCRVQARPKLLHPQVQKHRFASRCLG